MPDEITITLDLPPKQLSPNSRTHWRPRALATKRYKESAQMCAIAAKDGERFEWQKASAKCSFYFPDARRRDEDNARASLKAAFDGIVKAGILADDSTRHLTHEPAEFGIDRDRPRVEIRIRRMA